MKNTNESYLKRKTYYHEYYKKHKEEIKTRREQTPKIKQHIKDYQKNYHNEHREEILLYYRKWEEKNIGHVREYFRGLKRWVIEKLGRRCSKCGLISGFDCVYDFHHSGETKSWGSNSVFKHKELAKWRKENKIPEDVILLCANCHRIIHHPEENVSI